MPLESTPLIQAAWLVLGSLLFVMGGLRFRHWVVEDRPGIPKYSHRVETVMLWLVYSGGVAFGIIVIKQTLRHL